MEQKNVTKISSFTWLCMTNQPCSMKPKAPQVGVCYTTTCTASPPTAPESGGAVVPSNQAGSMVKQADALHSTDCTVLSWGGGSPNPFQLMIKSGNKHVWDDVRWKSRQPDDVPQHQPPGASILGWLSFQSRPRPVLRTAVWPTRA